MPVMMMLCGESRCCFNYRDTQMTLLKWKTVVMSGNFESEIDKLVKRHFHLIVNRTILHVKCSDIYKTHIIISSRSKLREIDCYVVHKSDYSM